VVLSAHITAAILAFASLTADRIPVIIYSAARRFLVTGDAC